MARLVDNTLKKPLAEALLFGELKNGGVARFDVEGDALKLKVETAAAVEMA
jgi:ATP-dependent Clp protease ATP-binding subunit ClpA